jgi:hypothetical protein
MGRAIFISYRRDDTEGEAGRLFDDLTRSFDDNSVFMDVAGINPGMDFRKAIDDNVASCGVLLAMIGPAWATISDSTGGRRLDDPNDFVRLEIASALAREVAVIPVLVHDAKMPRPDQLPENLKDLAFRNSVEITHTRWNSDVKLLTDALARYVAPAAATDTAPVHATVTVQLPPPTAPVSQHDPAHRSSLPLILGIVAAAVLALGIVGYLILRPVPPNPTADTSSYIGTWSNPMPEAENGINRVEVSAAGDQLSIHAWGKCVPVDCDWGTQTATTDGQQARAVWNLAQVSNAGAPGRTATVTIKPVNGQLSVDTYNTYSGRGPTQRQFLFVKSQ